MMMAEELGVGISTKFFTGLHFRLRL